MVSRLQSKPRISWAEIQDLMLFCWLKYSTTAMDWFCQRSQSLKSLLNQKLTNLAKSEFSRTGSIPKVLKMSLSTIWWLIWRMAEFCLKSLIDSDLELLIGTNTRTNFIPEFTLFKTVTMQSIFVKISLAWKLSVLAELISSMVRCHWLWVLSGNYANFILRKESVRSLRNSW